MATTSNPPRSTTDDKPQNLDTELEQKTSQEGQNTNAEVSKLNSATSVFMRTEEMREEQVQNAVKFLSHPKVRGSPVIYRRSFLEKKGLTKEEIDEAFRRVPDPPSSAQAASINQDGQANSSLKSETQTQLQTLQPAVAAPAGAISSAGALTRYRFHWSHAFVAVGVLAASGAGTVILFKKSIIPRFKSWIRMIAMEEEDDHSKQKDRKPSAVEEAAAAAKASAAAAADVAKAIQEMFIVKSEEKRNSEELMNLLALQVQEMKSMSRTVQRLEERSHFVDQEDHRLSVSTSKKPIVNGTADVDFRSVRSPSPSPSVEPASAPHPKSYMDIMAMVQRGEKPPNIKEVNDQPPNPNQQPSNPRIAPRTKPWEVGQVQNGSIQVPPSLSNGDSSVPWWQRKNDRIVELGPEDETKSGAFGPITTEQPPPVQRTWVPPQPPPVAMAGAAEAIRRPKPPVQKEQSADDQSRAGDSDVTDGVEIKGGYSGAETNEIQEQEYNHE